MRYKNDILINDKIKVWNVNKVKSLIGGLMSMFNRGSNIEGV